MTHLTRLWKIATRVSVRPRRLHIGLCVAVSLVLFSIVSRSPYSQQPPSKPNGKTTALSPSLSVEAARLLEQIKSGTAAYTEKLNNGVIEFSITISERAREPQHHHVQPPRYEDTGRWDITYQFDTDYQFYDVQARKKMEMNGEQLPDWQDMHHQYLVMEGTLYVWEKIGGAWKEHPRRRMPSAHLEGAFNPHWWTWHLPEFAKRIQIFEPIDVQRVQSEGIPHYLLTLHHTDKDTTSTIKIWIDPQRDYQTTRTLRQRTEIRQIRDPHLHLHKRVFLNRYTHELEQFEPNIWFPQTTTLELFIAVDENGQDSPSKRKMTMQVHHAVFNTPMDEKFQQK